jgi:hypothetical protein
MEVIVCGKAAAPRLDKDARPANFFQSFMIHL